MSDVLWTSIRVVSMLIFVVFVSLAWRGTMSDVLWTLMWGVSMVIFVVFVSLAWHIHHDLRTLNAVLRAMTEGMPPIEQPVKEP